MSMSPHGLVQERVARDLHYPWRVLVCCAFMNRTTKEQARPALAAFFAVYPTPEALARGPGIGAAVLNAVFRPLGLEVRRSFTIARMTDEYLARVSPHECFGSGQYARDALALFCAGNVIVDPTDHYLGLYAAWRFRGGPRIEWDEEGFLEWTVS